MKLTQIQSLGLGFLLGMILIVLSNLLSWINEESYIQMGELIGYKWLLTILILLFLSLIFTIFYYRSQLKNTFKNFANESTNPQNKLENSLNEKELQNKKIIYLKDLSFEEKERLKLYIDNNSKVQNFPLWDTTVIGLINVDILYIASKISFRRQISVAIDEFCKNYLIKHKFLLNP